MRRTLMVSIMLASVFAVVFVSDCRAADTRELVTKEKKLEDLRKRLRETKSSIKEISRKETGILEELERMDRALKAKRDELKRLDASLSRINSEITVTDRKIGILRKEKARLDRRLVARLRAMYKMRSGAMVPALFSAAGSGDTGRRYKYLSAVMDADRRLLEDAQRNLAELADERRRLKVLQQRLYSTRKEAKLKKREAEAALRKRRTLLASIRKRKDNYLRLAKELEEAQAGLLEVIERLRREEAAYGGSGFAAMRGRLAMPVDGRIVSFYGKVTHPRFKTVTFNNGIVIKAPFGTGVKSVYDGNVIYVGWLKGYGQVLIMDHGGGFYTLFAYLSEVLKKKGDRVEKGEVVGLVGDSGPHDVAGLYFEVRYRGIPKDPLVWLDAGRRRGR